MTISSETRRAGPYSGNGSTVNFPFAFKVFATNQVLVTRTVSGVETVLTLTTDYTVTLNADQNANPGGTVTMLVAPPAGHSITITSNLANLQPTALANLGGFYPEVINDSLDRATIQIQQLDERLDRALVIPVSSSGIDTELPPPESGKLIGWDGLGTSLQNYSNLPTGPTVYQYVHQLIATAGQTVVGLPVNYTLGANAITVFVNGLRVEPGSGLDYVETNTTTITFNSGLASGDLVVVAIHGNISTGILTLAPVLGAVSSLNFAAGDYIEATGVDTFRARKLTVATYAALTAIPAASRHDDMLVYVASRSTDGDGGDGYWRFDAGSSATANGGTILAPDAGTGRWIRQVENGEYLVNWFGSSADWGAAASAAFAALPSTGGVVKFRPSGDYTLSTQVTCDKSFVKLDISGCVVRQRFTTGAQFKFGNGTTLRQSIAVIGDGSTYIDGGTTANHPLFELRGVRNFRTQQLFGDGIYQLCKWGDVADTQACYQWWNVGCEFNMRTNANGGHTHAIIADGSSGGYYEADCFFEGDAANVASSVSFFRLTSAQAPARFDGLTRTGGNWKYFDNGIYCVDARLVNVDLDPSSRIDDMQSWAIYILCQAAASKGGVEQLNAQGHFGGFNEGGCIYIRDEKGSVGFDDISITNVDTSNQKDTVVSITTSGSGAIRNVLLNNLGVSDFDPSNTTKRIVELSGDITLANVDGVNVRHKTGAANNAQYVIYNDTASTKRVKIGANIVWDAVGTSAIYDPNIGDMSIGRFCALRPDGTPRGGPVHLGPFSINNIAASITNGDIGIRNDGGLAVLAVPAFDRCRVIGLTASLLGTPSAGTLTINANPNAAGADTNLQVQFTSADGANPRKRVLYPAGTASIAAAGSIRLLYTTDGSWSPTTSELVVYQIVQEM